MQFDTICAKRFNSEKERDLSSSLHLSTAFSYESAQQAGDIFANDQPGHSYTRISNPTHSNLELKLAMLDRGVGSLVTSSGHSAQLLAFHTLLEEGDHFIASPYLYGGSINQFELTFKKLGWHVSWVDVNDIEALQKAVLPNTKLIFAEMISNPLCTVLDIDSVVKIADAHHIPLIVDNTTATPYHIAPLTRGASLVTYSLTKYMGGHGNAVGGAIIEGDHFKWAEHKKYKNINEPRPEYDNQIFSDLLPEAPFSAACRAVSMRDLGACLSPFNAQLIMMGLETLHLRMASHNNNAMHIMKGIQNHPKIKKLHYAGLSSHSHHHLAKKYLYGVPGAILSFEISGGEKEAFEVIDKLKLFKIAANIGDTQSMVIHPASTTHRQLSPKHKKLSGITNNLIRLSIGIEYGDDLLQDILQALD